MRYPALLSLLLLTVATACGQAPKSADGSALQSSGSPPDVCQKQGPVTVCNGNGLGAYFTVVYEGYLAQDAKVGACRPDAAAPTSVKIGATINGDVRAEAPLLKGCFPGGKLSAVLGAQGFRRNHVEVYFVDEQARYDSQFGRNYQFDF